MPSPQKPGTNQHRCESCGRHFNTSQELAEHQKDCLAAWQSGHPDKPTVDHPLEEGEDREWKSVP